MTNDAYPRLGERLMQTIDELCDSIGKSVDVSTIRVGDRVICGEVPHAYRGMVVSVSGAAVTVFHDYPCPDWHQSWNVDRVRPEPKSEDPDAQ